MTTHLDRDALLRLSPADAFAGGLGALAPTSALALAHQAAAEGAPVDVLGLGLVQLGMVRDQAGAGALTAAHHADLAQRLAFQADGYPRTGAWLAALAAAATTGADLDAAQAYLARTIELSRYIASGMWPTALTITVDGRRVGSPEELRAAVDAFNASRASAAEIPPALDPHRLAWSEVELFVARLATGDSTGAVPALELTQPGLKLFALDGLGAHGLAGSFHLRATPDGVAIEPAFDRRDVEADLRAAEELVTARDHAVSAAAAAVASLADQDPSYAGRHVAHLDARRDQVAAWIILGHAVRTAQAFLRTEATRGVAQPVVAMRSGPADDGALAARAAELDQAIVNGPRLGRLPSSAPGGAPGAAPGGAPGGAPGAAPGGRPGGAA